MVDQADLSKKNIPKDKAAKKSNCATNHIKGEKAKQAVCLRKPEFPQGMVKSARVLNPKMSGRVGVHVAEVQQLLPVAKSSSVCNVATRAVQNPEMSGGVGRMW